MRAKTLLEIVNIVSLSIGCALIYVLTRKRLLKQYWPLVAFIGVRILSQIVGMPPLFFRKEIGLSKKAAYDIIFYTSWPCMVGEAILMVLIVFCIYALVLKPFEPIRRLGGLIFRWVAAISLLLAVGLGIGPHMFNPDTAINWISKVQQTSSILTLCLLLFVAFALKPLGMTYGSRYFGICAGLGVMATVSLVQAAWFSMQAAQAVYSMVYFWSDLGVCAGLCIWGTYFLRPEPKQRIILLPTTSPYFLWNKISDMLGDSPGVVAVSGLTPESLAPAELQALMAASDKPEDQAPRMLNTAMYGS